MKITRRQFLLTGAAAAGIAGLGYARLLEPGWLAVTHVRLQLPAPPLAPLRLLFLSDLHWSPPVAPTLIEAAIETGLALKPDVICLGGDYLTVGADRPLGGYREILQALSAAAPCYAVLGNHDGGVWSAGHQGRANTDRAVALLRSAGIVTLEDEAAPLPAFGLQLVGLRDLWNGRLNPTAAFRAVEDHPTWPIVVLAHNPDTKDAIAVQPWHLMLSGHTHGGQVVVPFVGPPYVPVNDRRYVAGLKAWGERQIYVTRGVGNLKGLRFNCRPEVTLFELA